MWLLPRPAQKLSGHNGTNPACLQVHQHTQCNAQHALVQLSACGGRLEIMSSASHGATRLLPPPQPGSGKAICLGRENCCGAFVETSCDFARNLRPECMLFKTTLYN